MDTKPKLRLQTAVFKGIDGHGLNIGDPVAMPHYPFWMYKDGDNPILVHGTDEEANAKANGYALVTAGTMANKTLVNWFWDLEDFSSKQLKCLAMEEYGVDLPIEAGQEKLFQAVIELARWAPQNHNRLVMMAHTIAMNYDATLEEIKRCVANPGIENVDVFYEEFTA